MCLLKTLAHKLLILDMFTFYFKSYFSRVVYTLSLIYSNLLDNQNQYDKLLELDTIIFVTDIYIIYYFQKHRMVYHLSDFSFRTQ
jgi:hypothetical protein